jgi:hypothetical protein
MISPDQGVELADLLNDDYLVDDLAPSFEAVAAALTSTPENGIIQVTLRDGEVSSPWCLALIPGRCDAAQTATKRPDLEIITRQDTWIALLHGEITPLGAFAAGKLRVRGSLTLGRALARGLCSADDRSNGMDA